MATGGVDAKVYVVSNSQERKTDRGEYGLTVVYDNTSQGIKQMTFPLKFTDNLLTGKFYLIKAVSIGDTIRLYETSRVFECGKFPIEMDKINKYLNPPELSVEQVMETPQKSTVTVKGILRNETEEEGKFNGEVEALEVSENYSYIIINGMTLKIRTEMVEAIFQGQTFKENTHVKGSVKGTTVVEIHKINPAKKSKSE